MKAIMVFAQAVSAATLLMVSAQAGATPRGELRPSGGDDTQLLQGALLACTDPHRPCDLRLGAGVFHTDVLLVEGFNGSIRGSGQGRTIIRALPKLRSGSRPFDEEPTLTRPYPVLLHFYGNSNVSLAMLTVDVPAGITVAPYSELGFPNTITNSLWAAIAVTGDRKAELTMRHVTIRGADNDAAVNFSTLTGAVLFGGEVRDSGNSDRTRKLQRGRFVAHDNDIQRTGVGFWFTDGDNIDASVTGNRLDVRTYGVLTADLGASNVGILLNDIRAELEGVLLTRNTRPADVPTDYAVALNRFRINVEGTAVSAVAGPSYDGVGVYDWSQQSDTINFNADIWANDAIVGPNTIAGFSVYSDGPGQVRLIGNRVRGEPPLDAGIVVDMSRGTVIVGNDLDQNDPALVDVHLGVATHEVRVIEPNDHVVDDGSGNHVN